MNIDILSKHLSRLGIANEPVGDSPRAAVAAILRQTDARGSAEMLFIRRAERVGDPWSGHIAFPGGRCERDDETVLSTAIRETREEIGVDLTSARVVARLPDVPAFVRSTKGSLVVTPYVFALENAVVPILNEEVAEVLWTPFDKIASGEWRGTFDWKWKDKPIELPCMRLQPGAHVLWGMTFRMVETMLDALGPEDDTPGPYL